MSPSARLCLLTIVGLIVPTRGQTSQETTSTSLADPTTVNIHTLTQAPGTVQPDLQPTPQTSTLQAGDTTPSESEKETQTQRPTETEALLTTNPGMSRNHTEAFTLSKRRSPGGDVRTDPALRPAGSGEDDPFSYDEDTLRKRGLLVAAVLFITGIVILTSGKCRQLPRLCKNYHRAYRIVSKGQPKREDADGARAHGPGPLPSPPLLP